MLRITQRRIIHGAMAWLVVFVLLSPLFAAAIFAAAQSSGVACNILERIFFVVKILGSVVLVIAIVMLLWAGILFMTGGGNEEKIKQARLILIYSLVGLAVAILALQADNLVATLFANVGTFLDECRLLNVSA